MTPAKVAFGMCVAPSMTPPPQPRTTQKVKQKETSNTVYKVSRVVESTCKP